jgi:lipopolysaccharide/colanic/teichoic acid biosynthesis glycosyltransferase
MDRKQLNVGTSYLTETVIDLTGEGPAVAPLVDAGAIYSIHRSFYLRGVKPLIDRLGGLIALIALSPVYALIGLAIWVTMGGPVLIRQERVGLHGQVFTLYKFRSMAPDRRRDQVEFIGEDRRMTHMSAEDPRITPLGRWLRATRLDEIPQFINVVRGELSLVGPRPELVDIVARYEPWQHRRHAVKPGVTGLWQVSDMGDKLLVECTEYELEYLDHLSLALDFRILMQTLPAMARRSGI